jgi:hypothetical protein
MTELLARQLLRRISLLVVVTSVGVVSATSYSFGTDLKQHENYLPNGAAAAQHFSQAKASIAARRVCSRETTVEPSTGGYAIIIDNLRVSRISCAAGLKVAGRDAGRGRSPGGWNCSTRFPTTTCRRGQQRVQFSLGGDAG